MNKTYVLELKTNKKIYKVKRDGLLGFVMQNTLLVFLSTLICIVTLCSAIQSTKEIEECFNSNSHLTSTQQRSLCTLD